MTVSCTAPRGTAIERPGNWRGIGREKGMKTANEIKGRMDKLFAELCEDLGVKPIYPSIGIRSSASFATAAEADILRAALVEARATRVLVHHWSAAECPDFEQDEWQVSWGDL